MGWRDTIQGNAGPMPDKSVAETPEGPQSSWRNSIRNEDTTKSPVTTMTTGLIQGAVPFASALAGAGKAGMDAITGVRGPLAGEDLGSVVDDYRQARDSFSGDAKRAAEENPKTALAFNIAGGLFNPLFKGADSLPKIAGAGAAQALGQSNADLTKGDVGQAGKDAAYGAGAALTGYAAGKAIGAAVPYGKSLVKKALTTLGPSEEAIDARLAGMAQPDAKSYPELAEDMGGSLKSLKGQIGDASDAAKGTLSTESTLPKEYVTAPIDEAMASQGKLIGSSDKQIDSTLKGLKEDLAQFGPNISQTDLKTLIKKMDSNINWDDQSQNAQNTVLEGLRRKYDDILKFQNPQYKAAMTPVSDRMSVLDSIKRKFNFRNVPGEGLQPTDTTATKMQTALRDNKAVTQGSLDDLNQYVGKNYQDLAKDYQLSQQFENTGPNGARRTVLGGAVGGLIGHGSPLAIGVGAGAGAILDRYGGQAVGDLIDGYLKAGNSKVFQQFAPVLQEASRRGPQALSVTASVLSKDPNFRKVLDSLNPL